MAVSTCYQRHVVHNTYVLYCCERQGFGFTVFFLVLMPLLANSVTTICLKQGQTSSWRPTTSDWSPLTNAHCNHHQLRYLADHIFFAGFHITFPKIGHLKSDHASHVIQPQCLRKYKSEMVAILRLVIMAFTEHPHSRVCKATYSLPLQVGNTPGVTKGVQEIHLDKSIRLLDSPGVVFSSASDDASAVLRNCVKVRWCRPQMCSARKALFKSVHATKHATCVTLCAKNDFFIPDRVSPQIRGLAGQVVSLLDSFCVHSCTIFLF